MLSNFLNIIFAPAFVVLIHYFEFRSVVLLYLVMAVGFFIYKAVKKSTLRDMMLPTIYVVALSFAYYFSSLESVKYIPVTLSSIFLFLFIDSHFNKKEMVLGFTRQFYKKELSEVEVEYLKKGDGYWVVVMLINTLIHLYVVNFTNDVVWAFYASVGWYILFFVALFAQIIYGKVFYVRLYSR
ncbi:MAG: hypothetical protein GXO30_00105 [Epsilonproteobacteria bacterium]|nr:hypothetical protein [Campylobacterota bacterium]